MPQANKHTPTYCIFMLTEHEFIWNRNTCSTNNEEIVADCNYQHTNIYKSYQAVK